MKKIIFSMIFIGMMLFVVDNAMAQNCKPQADQVAVFTAPLYQGDCTILETGEYPEVIQILKDFTRSIIIGSNVKTLVCEDSEFKGSCTTMERSGDIKIINSARNTEGAGVSFKITRRPSSPVNATNRNSSRDEGVIIFDKKTEYIIGGYQYGRLVDSKIASGNFKMGENYSFYGLDSSKNSNKAMLNRMIYSDRCSVYYIETNSGDGAIALSPNANWNPTPRTPRIISTQDKTYTGIVKKFLQSKGISNFKVNIDQIFRVDLEGDGQDEVIISARNIERENDGQTIKKGSYSFLIVRKIIDGEVETISIGSEIYTENVTLEQWQSREREVTAILDIDADGIMEIVVYTNVYEGSGTDVYKINNKKAESVLSVGCGA